MKDRPRELKISSDKKLEVELVGWIEPNHYNMCMLVEIYYEGKDIGRSIRDRDYKMAHFFLDKWVIDDPNNDNDYYYIPMVETTVILDKQTLKVEPVQYREKEKWSFRGNYFENHFLVENFYKERVITNLDTLITYEIEKKPREIVTEIDKIELMDSKFSIDKKLEIQFLEVEEPNSGRMLWKVSIIYEGVNLNEFVFLNDWNYLNFELDNWVLEGYATDYYYIPTETQSILIHQNTLKIEYLPAQPISTVRFEGNYFKGDFLIEKYADKFVKTNLKTFVSEETGKEPQLEIPFPIIRKKLR